MPKHCPTCNRSSDEARFIGEFCAVCVTGRVKEGIPDVAAVEVCKSCGRIRSGEGFATIDNASLGAAIRHSLGTKCDVSVESFTQHGAAVHFYCGVEGGTVDFEKTIRIKANKTMCTSCYRKTSGYYEAIVQLRGDGERVEKMMAKLFRFVEARGAFVSRVDELESGCNIYLSDKRIAGSFFAVNKLKPKKSFTLYGVKRGNKVYRNVFLLRLE